MGQKRPGIFQRRMFVALALLKYTVLALMGFNWAFIQVWLILSKHPLQINLL